MTLLFCATIAGSLIAPVVLAQETTTIAVGDIYFCDAAYTGGVCETTIDAGGTVVWDFSGATIIHTTTACGASCDAPTTSPLWNSGFVDDGSSFSYTFTEPGTYPYFCLLHPLLQRGVIVVRAPAPATAPPSGPTPTVDPNASPTSTPAVVGPPDVGSGPRNDGDIGQIAVALATLGLGFVIASTVLVRRSRTIESN